MKTIFTFCLGLFVVTAMAQVPTNFGTEAEDGITYQNYNLIDHGAVSSVRFMAQNAIASGVAEWNFYTGNYDPVWRPYTADDTLSSYNMMIDPSIETASARFNTNSNGLGGAPGRLRAIQAGYYYTAIIGNGTGDNFMSIVETDFAPVAIDTVYITPTNPTTNDDIVFTVELDGATMLSPGEHVFIRAAASPDFTVGPTFNEVTNFSNGVGTLTVPAGTIPAGVTAHYYALVTSEETPLHETIDYFTLFFANNSGNNYEFTVSALTGIEDVVAEYGIVQRNGNVTVSNASGLTAIELVSINGQVVANKTVNGTSASLNTEGLASGVYVLNLISGNELKSQKIFVD